MEDEDIPWMEDSDRVFNTLSDSMESMQQARNAITALYMPDLSYSRAGLCHAIKRLERHFEEQQT